MKKYRDISGISGVSCYEIQKDAVTVQFHNGGTYLYTYKSTGKNHVENMKELAEKGKGLSTYIQQHVREHYAAKTEE